MRIFKYQLQLKHIQKVKLPIVRKFLSVQNQGGVITFWVEIYDERGDADQQTEVEFEIHGTGLKFPQLAPGVGREREYRGTVQIEGYVWHVYEVRGLN